jgi:two-component system, NtrC family, sensor kinase
MDHNPDIGFTDLCRIAAMKLTLPFGRKDRTRTSAAQAVQDFNRSLALIADPESLQASIAARLAEITGADRIVMFELDARSGFFVPGCCLGVQREALRGRTLAKGGHLARWLVVNEAVLVVADSPGVVEYLEPGERQLLADIGAGGCLPLIALNRLVGIVLMGVGSGDWAPSPDELELVRLLAGHAGLAFENACLSRDQRAGLRRLDRAERLAVAGQLAAGVAHEIRNPLTAVRSTVQYLLADAEDTPKGALLRELITEIDRIDRTVDGLLNLTRARDMEPATLDVNEVVDETLVLVSAQAAHQRVSVERDHFRGQPLTVLGDARQLRQVFLNVALNALQAMPDGGRLSVKADAWRPALSDAAPGWAQVAMSDSGPGIPPNDLERVFDPFFTTKREGTGLGLSTCYWIVQRHDGEIDVRSDESEGTVVTVRLPLARDARRAIPAQQG